MPQTLSLTAARTLVTDALTACRTAPEVAQSVATALVAAEADGQPGHGLSRAPSYAAQSKVGKVDGFATPMIEAIAPGVLRVDAGYGFAFPAIDMAIGALGPMVREQGIAIAAIHRSHHFGQAGAHCERLARAGLVAFVFGNSPKAIAPWGGTGPMLGTNPIAFAAPMPGDPLVIDLALSRIARGKIMAAGKRGETIPEGWALDAQGNPTTDPDAALAGSMIPIGEAKGAALALMVEVMAAALVGAHFGFEASSLLNDKGDPPNLGQTILALDPDRVSAGAFADRMSVLAAGYEEQGARLPGTRRMAARARAEAEGLSVPDALYEEIRALCAP